MPKSADLEKHILEKQQNLDEALASENSEFDYNAIYKLRERDDKELGNDIFSLYTRSLANLKQLSLDFHNPLMKETFDRLDFVYDCLVKKIFFFHKTFKGF